MHNTPIINNKQSSFLDIGKGYPIILLHGYIESLDVWGKFAQELSKNYRLV